MSYVQEVSIALLGKILKGLLKGGTLFRKKIKIMNVYTKVSEDNFHSENLLIEFLLILMGTLLTFIDFF